MEHARKYWLDRRINVRSYLSRSRSESRSPPVVLSSSKTRPRAVEYSMPPPPLPPRPLFPFWNYTVEFKRERSEHFIGPPGLPLYSFVFVEADRGYDLGCVIGAFLKRESSATTEEELPKRILESATRTQILALEQKTLDEHSVLQDCQNKVAERQLPMTIVDAEYQYDRNKLTFYFSASKRVDFRDLVRDLYVMHKIRIWMQRVEECDDSFVVSNQQTR